MASPLPSSSRPLMVHLPPLFYLPIPKHGHTNAAINTTIIVVFIVHRILVATNLSVEDKQIKMIIVRNDTNVVELTYTMKQLTNVP